MSEPFSTTRKWERCRRVLLLLNRTVPSLELRLVTTLWCFIPLPYS